MPVWFCMYIFLQISFFPFFPPILGSRLTSTIQKYITTEIVKDAEAKNGRQWRAWIWVPKLPACSLAANVLQCNVNTTRESKMAATFSFYPCGWFFSSILSSHYFYSNQPKRSFQWRRQKEILKYEKCIKRGNERKAKACTEMKWLAVLSSFVFCAIVSPAFLPRHYYGF